jgi:hypothetical protein
MYFGQAEQDKFVLHVLKQKRNGYFVEIGSNHPVSINNTYLLETQYDWKGILVEYEDRFLPLYQQYRPASIPVIQNAVQVDYKTLFQENNIPTAIDYLQIDLEANNGSTIQTLENLNTHVFNTYTFATVTFEHDIYHTNFGNTRQRSREIFADRGYVSVFQDVNNMGINPYEDWYVHPTLVDMDYVETLKTQNEVHYKDSTVSNIRSINWQDIEY